MRFLCRGDQMLTVLSLTYKCPSDNISKPKDIAVSSQIQGSQMRITNVSCEQGSTAALVGKAGIHTLLRQGQVLYTSRETVPPATAQSLTTCFAFNLYPQPYLSQKPPFNSCCSFVECSHGAGFMPVLRNLRSAKTIT